MYEHYCEVLDDLRDQFEEFADELMPIVDGRDELARLVTPTIFLVRKQLGSSVDRTIGLLCECTWAVDLGLAVKLVNEVVTDVGPQSNVL